MTLRTRIYMLVATAVMPSFALLAFDHYRDVHFEAAKAEQQALQSTFLVAAELDQFFRRVQGLLQAAAQTPIVQNFEQPACNDYLSRLERIELDAGWIFAAAGRGVVRCGKGSAAISPAEMDYFAATVKADELVIGAYSAGAASQVATLPVAIRVQTVEGPGFLALGVRLDRLRELFADRFSRLPPKSSLTIVDRNGVILVRLPNFDRVGKPLTAYKYVVTAPEPGTFRSSAENNADGIARFLGFVPLDSPPRGVAVAVGFPQKTVMAEVRAGAMLNYALLSLVAILTTAAAILGGRFFIRRPVNEILATVEKWRNQDLTARVRQGAGSSEFDRLGQTFNLMADELEAALRHKDVLLRELSHRVMNTLQTLSALFRLEARQMEDRSAAVRFEQAIRRVDAVALTYKRMQANEGVEAIEFSGFLVELCRDLNSSMSENACVVSADPILLSPQQVVPLSLVVNELVTNAIKHGKHESGPIELEFKVLDGFCRLAIRNKGSLPQGFKPETKGFGMKMVSSMARQLRGELEIASADGTIEFALKFPKDRA